MGCSIDGLHCYPVTPDSLNKIRVTLRSILPFGHPLLIKLKMMARVLKSVETKYESTTAQRHISCWKADFSPVGLAVAIEAIDAWVPDTDSGILTEENEVVHVPDCFEHGDIGLMSLRNQDQCMRETKYLVSGGNPGPGKASEAKFISMVNQIPESFYPIYTGPDSPVFHDPTSAPGCVAVNRIDRNWNVSSNKYGPIIPGGDVLPELSTTPLSHEPCANWTQPYGYLSVGPRLSIVPSKVENGLDWFYFDGAMPGSNLSTFGMVVNHRQLLEAAVLSVGQPKVANGVVVIKFRGGFTSTIIDLFRGQKKKWWVTRSWHTMANGNEFYLMGYPSSCGWYLSAGCFRTAVDKVYSRVARFQGQMKRKYVVVAAPRDVEWIPLMRNCDREHPSSVRMAPLPTSCYNVVRHIYNSSTQETTCGPRWVNLPSVSMTYLGLTSQVNDMIGNWVKLYGPDTVMRVEARDPSYTRDTERLSWSYKIFGRVSRRSTFIFISKTPFSKCWYNGLTTDHDWTCAATWCEDDNAMYCVAQRLYVMRSLFCDCIYD